VNLKTTGATQGEDGSDKGSKKKIFKVAT